MSIVAVAKRAGVSIATVSRVINDMDTVRGETAEQVRAAMRELGYSPPRVRRGPKAGRRRLQVPALPSGQIAVLTLGDVQGWLSMGVMASVVGGITRAAKEIDVWSVLDEMPNPRELSPIFRRREVDGAIVFCNLNHSKVGDLLDLHRHIPIVWVMGAEDTLISVDHVTPDNNGVGQLAYHYLHKCGCRQFAFIADSPDWTIIRIRGQAFTNAAGDAGIVAENYLLNSKEFSRSTYGGNLHVRESLDEMVAQLAARLQPGTGLFVPTDLLLTKLHPLMVRHGIWGDPNLKIVSCDNEEPRLSQLSPRPPSIDLHGEEIGRLAVRQLLQRLQYPETPPARLQLMPRLVMPPVA